MGVMAESMTAYAQPLLDETDGSPEQVEKAMSIAMILWNISLFPEKERENMLVEMQTTLKMDDAEFAGFRDSVIEPMILRHHEMFPNMPRPDSEGNTSPSSCDKKYPGTGRNAPCPCNSGKKYKRCCGR